MSRKQSGKAVRGNRKCEQERRRDERAVRRALAKERRNRPAGGDEGEEFLSFSKQLQALGLRLREVPGDGNCLFRALADQLEGHSRGHERLRQEAVQHMAAHRQDFEPFVEDNVPFAQHLSNLSRSGTFAGNDAIVALARSQQLRVVIHQLDTPLWQISGTEKPRCRELHIAYRYGDHYDSVRKIGDNSEDAAHLRIENLEKCRSFGDEREEPPGASSSPSEDEELILSQCPAPPTPGQLGSGGCPELQAQRDSQAPPSHSEDQCAASPAEGGASQRVKARGKKKKDLQRLEKKKRQEERHKQKVSQGKDSPDQNQNPPDAVTLVPALSALSI